MPFFTRFRSPGSLEDNDSYHKPNEGNISKELKEGEKNKNLKSGRPSGKDARKISLKLGVLVQYRIR